MGGAHWTRVFIVSNAEEVREDGGSVCVGSGWAEVSFDVRCPTINWDDEQGIDYQYQYQDGGLGKLTFVQPCAGKGA